MKKIILAATLFVVINGIATAQQKVTIGTVIADTTALLQVNATNKGVLVPRLTNAQMNAIASPANGLLVYNTDSAAFAYRNATAWVFLKGSTTASNDWSTKGNAGTNAANNFIGTTDDVDLIFKRNNQRAGLMGASNTGTGFHSLDSITTGYNNTSNGAWALSLSKSGFENTATGFKALYLNTTGSGNTATGTMALVNNKEGHSNTANGAFSLFSNINGRNNTANGDVALFNNQSGNNNVAVGFKALHFNISRSNLVAIGDSALLNNGSGADSPFHAIQNTAVGSKALFANTEGYQNTGIGFHSLLNNTSGKKNTAVGYNALPANTWGFENTAMGSEALLSNTQGYRNIAIGSSALRFNETGNFNTAIGFNAGFFSEGDGNVFLGSTAGAYETGDNKLYINNSDGDANDGFIYGEFDNKKLRVNNKLGIGMLPEFYPLEIRGIGNGSEQIKFYTTAGAAKWHLNLSPGGSLNFVESDVADNRMVLGIGGEVGIGKIPLTTINDSRLVVKQKGSQNGIGVEASNNANHWDFYATTDAASNFNLYYNGAFKGTFDNVSGAYTATSDRRLKKDITLQQPVLNKVMQLQCYKYHYLDNQPTDRFSSGFMAQDVQKLFPDAVVENTMKDGETRLGINYQYFTVLAIKGLQEQQQQIQSQEERIAKLEALVKTLLGKK